MRWLAVGAGVLTLLLYAAAWGWAIVAGEYRAILVLVRAGLIAVALMVMGAGVWWVIRRRAVNVRSVVVFAPALVALMAVPLPYYSHGRAVQQRLRRAGVHYRVEPVGFSQTLHNFASDLLWLDHSELFASNLTWIEIDLSFTRQDQLRFIGNLNNLQAVVVQKAHRQDALKPELIEWLSRLPTSTKLDVALHELSNHDLVRLRDLRHRHTALNIYTPTIDTASILAVLNCPVETIQFARATFPIEFQSNVLSSTPANGTQLKELRVIRCDLTADQLLLVAAMSECEALTCDAISATLSVQHCEQLASLPQLKHLALGTMQVSFKQLKPLVSSAQLKTFSASANGLSDVEIEELMRCIPAGCSRRVRGQNGRGITVGDVSERRG